MKVASSGEFETREIPSCSQDFILRIIKARDPLLFVMQTRRREIFHVRIGTVIP